MSSKKHLIPLRKLLPIVCLLIGWFAQIIPLSAFTAEAEWKFETLQNASSEWWKTLTVKTVPGVVYHLQKSETLELGDWTNIASTYGTGGEWICPIFPGSAPAVAPPTAPRTLPSPTIQPFQLAFLVLEKTSDDEALISWRSLDDQTMRREVLTGVTLGFVWNEFDGGYIKNHGNYQFGISPRLHSPVTFIPNTTPPGPLDAAMIAAFTAALPTITLNIENSVESAANYTPQPAVPGSRGFYRFSANWSVDSDGDGRFDWQEIILDGNNPFAADSDGDGVPDQAAAAAAAVGLPTPTDAQPATPLAHIEQQIIHAGRYFVDYHDPDFPNYVTAWDSISGGGLLVAVEASALIAASSYSDFKTAVDQLEFAENGWTALTNFRDYQTNGHEEPPGIQTWDLFGHDRARFRLKLDAPAPEGGYKIPLRIGIVRSAPTGDPAYVEIVLECPEGETVGTPVNFSPPSAPGSNESIVYIPLSVSTMLPSANGAWSPPADGTCVTSSEAFLLDCGNWDPTLLLDGNAAALEVFWKKRKLKGDGTFEEWMTIYDPGHFDPANPLMPLPLKGPSKTVSGMNGGIYQLKAVVVLPDSSIVEVPFVRMRDARSNVDSGGNQNALLIAGQPDYFGIYENLLSQSVRNAAIPWLGATGYNEDADVPIEPGANFFNASTKGKPKCNLFITHLSNNVGATTPYFNRKRLGILTPQSSAPIAKHDWYQNPEINIDIDPDGWNFLADATLPATNPTVKDFTTDLGPLRSWQGGPCPGMAVASPRTKAGTTFGHVGILDYDGSWINAGSKKVTKCLHLLDVVNDYKPNTFRSR